MDLQPYVDGVRHELAVAAAAGGPEAEALADRLTAPLDSAIRLALLEALSDAAGEITRELAPRRWTCGCAVVTRSSPSVPVVEDAAGAGRRDVATPESDDDGGTWRVTLRLPESLRSPGRRGRARRRAVGERVAGPRGRTATGRQTSLARRLPTSTSAAGSAERRNRSGGQCRHSRHQNRSQPSVEVVSGSVHVVATDRDDTVVQVRPRDPNRASDIRIAEGAASTSATAHSPCRRADGSSPSVAAARSSSTSNCRRVRAFRCRRRPRECVPTASSATAGSPRPVATPPCDGRGKHQGGQRLRRIAVENVEGRGGDLDGVGRRSVGELTGDVKFRAASGSLSVKQLHGTVNAQTASGDITVAAAVTGGVSVQTGSGDVESRGRGRHGGPTRSADAFGRSAQHPRSRRTARPTATKRSPCT